MDPSKFCGFHIWFVHLFVYLGVVVGLFVLVSLILVVVFLGLGVVVVFEGSYKKILSSFVGDFPYLFVL
jgi:hypothetical protein